MSIKLAGSLLMFRPKSNGSSRSASRFTSPATVHHCVQKLLPLPVHCLCRSFKASSQLGSSSSPYLFVTAMRPALPFPPDCRLPALPSESQPYSPEVLLSSSSPAQPLPESSPSQLCHYLDSATVVAQQRMSVYKAPKWAYPVSTR